MTSANQVIIVDVGQQEFDLPFAASTGLLSFLVKLCPFELEASSAHS